MSTEIVKHEQKLPKLEELYASVEKQESLSELGLLLNATPPDGWLQNHPIAKMKNKKGEQVPIKYIPIEIQEYLMSRIFGEWYCEIKDVKLIGNSVAVTIRVYYWYHFKPNVEGEWRWTEGVGASPLQTDAGAGATEFDKLKANAVQIGLPSAKSYAFKDAVESLGRIFGKDLNRKNGMDYYTLLYTKDGEDRFNIPIGEVENPNLENDESDIPENMRKDFKPKED